MARVSAKVTEVTGDQESAATTDAVAMGVGLVLFWPALFVLAGTDAGTPFNYHGNNAYQLELFVREEYFSPVEAIHTATGAAAEAIGLAGSIGTLEPGKEADLIIINEHLLEDLHGLTEGVETVYRGGVEVEPCPPLPAAE